MTHDRVSSGVEWDSVSPELWAKGAVYAPPPHGATWACRFGKAPRERREARRGFPNQPSASGSARCVEWGSLVNIIARPVTALWRGKGQPGKMPGLSRAGR